MPRAWTQTEIDKLNELRKQGVPASEIAVELKRSRAAIALFCSVNKDLVPPLSKANASKTRRTGATKRPGAWIPETHDPILIRLRNAGETTAEIAGVLGFTPEAIMKHTRILQTAHRLVYDPPPEKTTSYSKLEDNAIRRLYANTTSAEIAESLDRSVSSVQQRVQHLINTGLLQRKR